MKPDITVISGGQTGADRGALDAAVGLGLRWGGWAPFGWLDENGTIPVGYRYLEEEPERRGNGLRELRPKEGTPVPVGHAQAYRQRTKRNIEQSDGTLIVCRTVKQFADGRGSQLTWKLCRELYKPVLVVVVNDDNYETEANLAGVWRWLRENEVVVLNVAGPRESRAPGLQADTTKFICRLLRECSST
jgi:hypothetical protein